MRKICGQPREALARAPLTASVTQPMRPSLFSCPDMPMSTANQVSVSQAAFSWRQSFHEMTPSRSCRVSPIMAAMTLLTANLSPKIHRKTVTAMEATNMSSFELIGPIASSFLAAITGASGVSWISGGKSLKTM